MEYFQLKAEISTQIRPYGNWIWKINYSFFNKISLIVVVKKISRTASTELQIVLEKAHRTTDIPGSETTSFILRIKIKRGKSVRKF